MTINPKYSKLKALVNTPEYKKAYQERTKNTKLGIKMRQQRIKLKLTQQELANSMGVLQPVIARIESGESGVTSQTINKFCIATGLDLEFIDIEEQKNLTVDKFDIVDYVLDRAELMLNDGYDVSNKKLNKLLFFIQYEYHKIYQSFFINCHFKAWKHGPVCPEIYHKYKDCGYNPIKPPSLVEYNIEKSDKDFIDTILDNYVYKSAFQLEEESHKHDGWVNARKNGDSEIIDIESE